LDAEVFCDFWVHTGSYVRIAWNKGPGFFRPESDSSNRAIGAAAHRLHIGKEEDWKKSGNVRRWMQTTFVFWFVALLFGMGFYIVYYLV